MQQWEYRVEWTSDYFQAQDYWNRLGRAGWELVGVYCKGDEHHAIFKRPRISAPDPASIVIDDLDLSVSTFNILRRANIYTVGDFIDYCLINKTENRIIVSCEKLKKIRNMGKKRLDEVIEKVGKKLCEIGLELEVASDWEAITRNSTSTISLPDATANNEAKVDELQKSITICELELSVRAFNTLKRKGINTVADILDLLGPTGVGRLDPRSFEEVKQKLLNLVALGWSCSEAN